MELFLLPDTLLIEVVFIGWMTRDKPITCIATEAYGVFYYKQPRVKVLLLETA